METSLPLARFGFMEDLFVVSGSFHICLVSFRQIYGNQFGNEISLDLVSSRPWDLTRRRELERELPASSCIALNSL